ncbi:MAG: FAD-dependent oxidoreductase [Phycisphaerae bacterium]|nr:FAD-dependent oxidoreductase [Phycisphaerae bacterium]
MDTQHHDVDVCVVGGGLAGLCAAVSAARNGARVALVQDRSVLGGNASSEIRMWVCGARGSENKETALLEELQLENAYRNPTGSYPTWDSVLWGFARFQPRLQLFLNCPCTGCETETGADGSRRISNITCFQTTTQTWRHIGAKVFIDCSGDSILATPSGADFAVGREARSDFGEPIAPPTADRKTMGNTVLIQLRETDEEQAFTAPGWAYRFDSPDQFPARMRGVNGANFWWIELGGINDTIQDAERIGVELQRVAWGVWDYIKNRAPEKEKARNWALEWIGSLPGKRESRRYRGLHVLTQHDIEAGGRFVDVVAYGGWPMDDHHPAGLLFPGDPTVFYDAPSPYGIPLRSLISRNVSNLMFAGRNISATHAALSSTRVMGTCALLGQAAGTGAAIAVADGIEPAQLLPTRVAKLQATLMADDLWLPGLSRDADELALSSKADAPSLLDGVDRPVDGRDTAWEGEVGSAFAFRWDQPRHIGGLRLVFDSNLKDNKRMPSRYTKRGTHAKVPPTLVRSYRVEVFEGDDGPAEGRWRTVFRDDNNYQRLVHAPVGATASAVRVIAESVWGDGPARVFAAEPTTTLNDKRPPKPKRVAWSDVVASVPDEHLAPPDLSAASVTNDPATDDDPGSRNGAAIGARRRSGPVA